MTEIATEDTAVRLPAQAEAEFNRYMAELVRLNSKMDGEQESIERIKAETDSIKAESDLLKAESAALKAEARALLEKLRATVSA